jgi:hypothetical protein
MSNIHHFEGFSKPPKILTGADAALPVKPAGGARSLSAINPGMSAIEYIVENAKPGEVIVSVAQLQRIQHPLLVYLTIARESEFIDEIQPIIGDPA